jgi:hypothetical protein
VIVVYLSFPITRANLAARLACVDPKKTTIKADSKKKERIECILEN